VLQKHSIADLAGILGVSRTTVNKKIKKHGFNVVQEYVNSRPLKLILVSDEELQALKTEIELNRDDNTLLNNNAETNLNVSTVNKGVNSIKNQADTGNIVENILRHNETVLDQIRYYANSLVEAERNKVKLLEDLEKRKEDEYLKTMAENKQLREQNFQFQAETEKLRAENEKLVKKPKFKFWGA